MGLSSHISLSAIRRIFLEAGAQRVSEQAIIELRNQLENIGLYLSRDAVALAKYAGRVTVQDRDIKMALQRMRERERGT